MSVIDVPVIERTFDVFVEIAFILTIFGLDCNNLRMYNKILVICLLLTTLCVVFSSDVSSSESVLSSGNYTVECRNLRLGQFLCPDPNRTDQIDPETQQYKGCTTEGKAEVWCIAAPDIICIETNNSSFKMEMPCNWTNGYSLEVALLLSVFLGMFGIDRFYLGYPAIGLAKLCTLGFMFIGQLLDIILIATQVVGPADGSSYVIPYFGAGVKVIRSDNETYLLPQQDWNNVLT